LVTEDGKKARAGTDELSPAKLLMQAKKSKASHGTVMAQASAIKNSIEKDDGWKWAQGPEINAKFMDALKVVEEHSASSSFARLALQASDIRTIKKDMSPPEFNSALTRFSLDMDPKIDGLKDACDRMLRLERAQQ
jgi:hypothetical protein